MCGEKARVAHLVDTLPGSPPRVRGKGPCRPSGGHLARITPACAGKSLTQSLLLYFTQDHPRVCGEKDDNCFRRRNPWGSPPRVRGKVSEESGLTEFRGITPACAGKRLKRSHSIGHFSYILCLFHSVLHRASASGGSRAGPCAPPCLPAQNAVPV